MTFFEAMEILMREKGMNYKELAEKSGVYPSYISNLKSGVTADPRWDKACAIIDALGVSPNEFRGLMESDGKDNG